MRMIGLLAPALLAGLIAGVAGCGGPAIVPVSGKVTVDGKPHPGLVVSFQPIGGKGNENPGRGSSAVTNASGEFTLVYDGKANGAIPGKHLIRIFTQLGAEPPPDDTRESDPSKFDKSKAIETIPADWHENSRHEFTVPPGGTREANFAIDRSRKK